MESTSLTPEQESATSESPRVRERQGQSLPNLSQNNPQFGLPFPLQRLRASDLGLPESCSAESVSHFGPPVTSKNARCVRNGGQLGMGMVGTQGGRGSWVLRLC